MSHFGERLRQTRESQGLSLAQAAVETRILQQWLIALEEGAFERLPNDVVARGFIRNYAQYLGLPTDELIELYRRERGGSEPIQVVPTAHAPRSRSYVLPSFFVVFFVTMVLVGLTYFTLSAVGRVGNRATPDVAMMTTPTAPTPTSLGGASRSPTPGATSVGAADPTNPTGAGGEPLQPAATPTSAASNAASEPTAATGGANAPPTTTPTSAPSPTLAAPIVVEVSIEPGSGESWLRVQTDGTTAYEQIMQSGEREVFQANRQVFIRAGNPAVVQVTVNGRQRGTLGSTPGVPVNWYWPPQSSP